MSCHSDGASGDRARLFLTAMLAYALCLNPVLTNPMTWSALDAAGALVDTGRWQVPSVSVVAAPQALER